MWVDALLIMIAAYAVIGGVLGVWFVTRGVDRVDPVVAGSPRGFRMIILPGAVILWPIVLRVLLRVKR